MEEIIKVIAELQADRHLDSLDEASVSLGVILPILAVLGWNIHDVRNEVIPEYHVGDQNKVDFALRSGNKERVFIEVKKHQADLAKHQEQLLNYAFKHGVRIAVLANGIDWWFYLPLNEGKWEERRFYTISLYEHELQHTAENLVKFLSKPRITSGDAVKSAEEIYRKNQIMATLPRAWNEIIQDSTLQSLIADELAETTEKLCHHKPDKSEVHSFLNDNISKIMLPTPKGGTLTKSEEIVSNLEGPEGESPKPITKYDKIFYKGKYNPQSVDYFFKYVKEVEDLIAEKGWALATKFNRYYCCFKIGSFNVFGIKWIGTKTFAFFANFTKNEAEQLGVEFTRYSEQRKQAYYYVDPPSTKTENFTSVFELAYQKFSAKATPKIYINGEATTRENA